MTCGIYLLDFPNGDQYIGLSNNIERRWAHHRSALCNGYHSNNLLQASYDVWGDLMETVIIEECAEEELVDTEQYYIDFWKPNLNISYRSSRNRNTKKPVTAIFEDNTKEFFESVTDAADVLGLNSSAISQVCKGRQKHTGGIRFEYTRPTLST